MHGMGQLLAFAYTVCCCCCYCCVLSAIETRHVSVNEMAAANMESYMDATAQPCDNFYQYACGKWAQRRQRPEDGPFNFGDTLGLLDLELNRRLDSVLKRATPANESQPRNEDERSGGIYEKARTYYRACKKMKPYNLKRYLQLVAPGYGASWAILQRNGERHWNASAFDWTATVARLRLYGLNGVLLKEEVLPRWDESNSNAIYLDKPNLGETQPMGEGVMIELMLDIGQTKRDANRIAREVDEFERRLHKLQELEDDDGPKEMQLGYLQQYMKEIDWLAFVKQLKGATTATDTTVIIQNVPYMRSMVKLVLCTPKVTVCHYIMLRLLQFLKRQGPAEVSKVECVASLRRAMPLALSYIVGRHHYRDAPANDDVVHSIFEQLRAKFREMLSDNRLQLKRPIVAALLDKVDAMRLQVGVAPRNVTIAFYDDFYERIELDPNNYYVNQLSLLRLRVEKAHESLDAGDAGGADGRPYILHDCDGSSSSPFYVKPRNMIVVPYGFLHMPVYHRQLKDIFKYSILGFIVAHELLHGFDSSGIEYDSIGNIMGPSEEITANQRFMSGLRCMQHELATGSRSLNEKLADYEGLRLVYETYFHGNVSHEGWHAPTLPHLTEGQLFFISFAQFFCGKVHPQVRQASFMEHALDELRVLQTLANFEDFSKAFDCDKHAKMQSRKRCRVW